MIACELLFSVLVTGTEQRTGSGHRLELHHHDICAIRHNVGDEISLAVAIALDGLERGVGDVVRVGPIIRRACR